MRRGRVLGLGIRITLSPNKRGDNVKSLYRDHETTLDILEEHRKGGDPVKFDQDGVCALYQPFWHNHLIAYVPALRQCVFSLTIQNR